MLHCFKNIDTHVHPVDALKVAITIKKILTDQGFESYICIFIYINKHCEFENLLKEIIVKNTLLKIELYITKFLKLTQWRNIKLKHTQAYIHYTLYIKNLNLN